MEWKQQINFLLFLNYFFKMNKKGFELSINMMVVIILSLVLFGAGIFIFAKIINTSQDFKDNLDERTIEQLDQVMDDGSLVVVPRNSLTVKRGESALFAYGFWNEEGGTILSAAVSNFNVLVDDKDSTGWTREFVNNYQNIKINERVHGLISIQVPKDALKGQYAFDIEIEKNNVGLYGGSLKRIYVVVP